jgi:hypothetical protein
MDLPAARIGHFVPLNRKSRFDRVIGNYRYSLRRGNYVPRPFRELPENP